MTSDINSLAGEALKTIKDELPTAISADEAAANSGLILVLATTLMVIYIGLVFAVGVRIKECFPSAWLNNVPKNCCKMCARIYTYAFLLYIPVPITYIMRNLPFHLPPQLPVNQAEGAARAEFIDLPIDDIPHSGAAQETSEQPEINQSDESEKEKKEEKEKETDSDEN
ncbi:hypothetical protein, conserved [Plasmodium vivax]|uniref:(malaria parasite P. vivax) hypothetical protein n=1 Tax=Plasmodium vivax TaxID=5855 RepID=A0A1G4HI01_PLAVI|nr:unnamed protein product [Plasmodium vivax]SCO69088.1 hypothetical protein, conserved [Plasmodium vivax]SCO74553.1 hypothetical protein, conserved [Plasmodium vivax]VUZ97994.1 hypothetical protein PVP01_1270900 [Plasmodium vivax]